MTRPGIGLYIHVPWCIRKCPYCDFNSHPVPAAMPTDTYVAALEHDLDREAARCDGRHVTTIFFGGGTPSLFPPAAIGAILEAVHKRLPVTSEAEVTLEANPGTIEHGGRFLEYRAAGINRVSLGAQSFDPAALRALGRIHTPQDTVRAVEQLQAAGLDNFNLDLMYALPGQTVADALRDARAAVALAPAHVSLYQLTLEPGTVFHARPPQLPVEDDVYEMQSACCALLAGSGFERYEVSAFARSGRECRHNLNYWRYGDYAGIGAGAHGKLTVAGTVLRTERIRSPRAYLAAVAAHEDTARVSAVPEGDLPFEFMLNALRLRGGFLESEFVMATGLGFATVEGTLERLRARGLVARSGSRWMPTSSGFDFLNDLMAEFLPSPDGSLTRVATA